MFSKKIIFIVPIAIGMLGCVNADMCTVKFNNKDGWIYKDYVTTYDSNNKVLECPTTFADCGKDKSIKFNTDDVDHIDVGAEFLWSVFFSHGWSGTCYHKIQFINGSISKYNQLDFVADGDTDSSMKLTGYSHTAKSTGYNKYPACVVTNVSYVLG